jgi:hypothetical protein
MLIEKFKTYFEMSIASFDPFRYSILKGKQTIALQLLVNIKAGMGIIKQPQSARYSQRCSLKVFFMTVG